jgi:hypothetical protein
MLPGPMNEPAYQCVNDDGGTVDVGTTRHEHK